MVITALLAAAAIASPAEEFFPLNVGARWTYEDQEGRQLVQTIEAPMDLENGTSAIPRVSSAGGRKMGTELFRIDGDTVQLVGFVDSSKKPPINLFPDPQPILRITSGKAEWTYTDQVFGENGPIAVQIKSDSNRGPKRKVLDREVETVVVHTLIKYGNGARSLEVRRNMVYGKGIGMVETNEATKIQGKTVKKVLKLIKFEPGQS